MLDQSIIRETTPEEASQLLALYPEIFPDEELRPLVAALLSGIDGVLSLAAFLGGGPVAHVIFTRCGTEAGDRPGALLGPLGVLPAHQETGLGTAIVQAGLDRLWGQGVRQIFVLGNPNYYGRFGFAAEREVTPPCPILKDWSAAWQSMRLDRRAPLPPGPLIVPEPWQDPALWSD